MNWIACGAINAWIAVAAGAFAAHGLSQKLSPRYLEVFKTAATYQFFHALGLILFGFWIHWAQNQVATSSHLAGWLLLIGIILFSGSLYALALSGISFLGAITPLGGLSFLAGWGVWAFQAIKNGPSGMNL